MKEERLDRNAFSMLTFAEADNTVAFWRQKTPGERIHAAYILSIRAYGYDPENEPRLDRTVFSMRKLQ
jgi:hypothetical protein